MSRAPTVLALAALFAIATLMAAPADASPGVSAAASRPYQNAPTNDLYDVSCVSVTFCVAVGGYRAPGEFRTLIESWDGRAWHIVPSPSPGDSGLNGVSCVSVTSCTAVGFYINGSAILTLVESWDGTSWIVVPSPNPNTTYAVFSDVSCASTSSCSAVGLYEGEYGIDETLIESWDGRAWKIVPSPNPGPQGNGLGDVSCTSASSCVAVGSSLDPNHNGRTLVEMLASSPSGAVWRTVPSPNPGTGSGLFGVSCTSASSCTAVGSYSNGSDQVTLVETWDGTSWIVVPSPNPSDTMPNQLVAVSCVSADSCATVGYYNVLPLGYTRTLIESWDGTAWKIASSPNPGTYQNDLFGVSCVSASSCNAAGYFSNGFVDLTLIEAWDGMSWSVVRSPNIGLP